MIATPQAKLELMKGKRWRTHWRLLIADADGTFRDYSAQAGQDFREGAEWGKTIDQTIADGVITLRREAGGVSIAPMIDASALNRNAANAVAPAIEMGRRLQIWEQVTAAGAAPVEADWVLTYDAIVQKVNWADTVVQLPTLDRASLLQKMIRVKRTYGSSAGIAVQTVMQSIIDDNLGVGVFTLNTVGDPAFSITSYTPYEVTVWDALMSLAQQFAGYVELRQSTLTLVVPNRTAPTAASAVMTFGPEHYKTLPRLEVDIANLRNVVRVTHRNAATGAVEFVEATDAGSIAAYGEQFLGITEGDTSAIDTTPEAQDMADRVLADLSAQRVEQQVVNWHFYPVELGDHITWKANGRHYDSDQHWAVTGFRHRLSRDNRETTFDVRGAASGGYRRYLRLGTADHPPVTAEKPNATIRQTGVGVGTRTVEYSGALGAGASGPLEWQRIIVTGDAAAEWPAVWDAAALPASEAVAQDNLLEKVVMLRTRDGAGRISPIATWPIPPILESLDRGTGRIVAGTPMTTGFQPFGRGGDTLDDVLDSTNFRRLGGAWTDTSHRLVNVYRGGVQEGVANLFKRGANNLDDVLDSGGFRRTSSGFIDANHRVANVYRSGVTEDPANLFKRGVNTVADVIDAESEAGAAVKVASYGVGAIHLNPAFAKWTGTYPDGWSLWNLTGASTFTKDTGTTRSGGAAANWNAAVDTDAGMVIVHADSRMQQGLADSLLWVTIEVDVYFASGGAQGSGILVDFVRADASYERAMVDFSTELGNTPQTGKWHTIRKVLKRSPAASALSGIRMYAMANWGGLGGGVRAAKNILIDRIALRESTNAEIAAHEAIENPRASTRRLAPLPWNRSGVDFLPTDAFKRTVDTLGDVQDSASYRRTHVNYVDAGHNVVALWRNSVIEGAANLFKRTTDTLEFVADSTGYRKTAAGYLDTTNRPTHVYRAGVQEQVDNLFAKYGGTISGATTLNGDLTIADGYIVRFADDALDGAVYSWGRGDLSLASTLANFVQNSLSWGFTENTDAEAPLGGIYGGVITYKMYNNNAGAQFWFPYNSGTERFWFRMGRFDGTDFGPWYAMATEEHVAGSYVAKAGATMSGTLTSTKTGTAIALANTATLAAKNTTGGDETFLWPRWSDNQTYFNYGSGGQLNIRNNAGAAKLTIADAAITNHTSVLNNFGTENTWTGSSGWNTFKTFYGNIQLGPANADHGHIYTDRASFYFNKPAYFAGWLDLNGNVDVGGAVIIRDDTNQGGANNWGLSIIRGRVWSASANIHLSPPSEGAVNIDTGYREAGGTTGVAHLNVSGNITSRSGAANGVAMRMGEHGVHLGYGAIALASAWANGNAYGLLLASTQTFLNVADATGTMYLRRGNTDMVRINGDGMYLDVGWFRPVGSNGVYWGWSGHHLYPASAEDFILQSGATAVSLRFADSAAVVRGYIHATGANDIGILDHTRTWTLRVNGNQIYDRDNNRLASVVVSTSAPSTEAYRDGTIWLQI